MNRRLFFQLGQGVLLLYFLFIVPVTHAQGIAIIMGRHVNPKQLTLNAKEVRQIFLRKAHFTAQGEAWVPVNLSAANPVRIAMTQKILQKTVPNLERYWSEMYFNGISPPYVLASEEAVISFIVETPGAISYVPACRVDSRVHVIYRIQVANYPVFSCTIK